MSASLPERDERTVMVENAGYRLSYLVLSYGLLVAVMYRSLKLHQASWDLLALVVLGGAVSGSYQALHRVLGRRWLRISGLAFVLALLIAATVTTVKH